MTDSRIRTQAEGIHVRLAGLAEAEFAAGQRRFFRHEVDTYGVRTADLKRLEKDVYREIKRWELQDRNRLMERLWKTGKLESGVLVCHLCRRFEKTFGEAEFAMFERWLDRYVRNWAHCDGVASWLIAGAIRNVPALAPRVMPWTQSQSRWKRRASAVSLLQEAKQGRSLALILQVADELLDDRDDMVEKGVGWLLKESYPKRPEEVVRFLAPRRSRASRTTLRYAAEKMRPADRVTVLS